MNPIQKKLLELADTIDIGKETTYRLAKMIGIDHPFRVKYGIEQLIKNGYLIRDSSGSISKVTHSENAPGLISIPYYGEVNCGEALALADDTVKYFLQVSPSIVRTRKTANLFALKACGQSMNQASIHGKHVEDGDYVIAERKDAHQIGDGDYVVSVIGGAANLKRFYRDRLHRRIVLFSESTNDLPPIIISEHDADEVVEYQPIAQVVDVIKRIQTDFTASATTG